MSIGRKLPNYKNRLQELRKKAGFTQQEIADKLQIDIKTYRTWEKRGISEKASIYNACALADLYNVSIDYVLGASDFTSVDNEYISQQLGLNDTAIKTLKHQYKYETDMINGADVVDDDTGNIIFHGVPQQIAHRPINTLNDLLSNGLNFEFLFRAIQDYIHADYAIPVFHTGKSAIVNGVLYPEAVISSSELDYIDNQNIAVLSLAKTKNNPYDTNEVFITKEFLRAVALQHIQNYLNNISDDINNSDD